MKKWIIILALPIAFSCTINKDNPGPAGTGTTDFEQPEENIIQHPAYTYPSASGNRVLKDPGMNSEFVVDVPLSGKPVWVAATSSEETSYWVAVLENGETEAFQLHPDRSVTPLEMKLGKLPPGMPPTLALNSAGIPFLVNDLSDAGISHQSAPLVLSSGKTIHISQTGDLILKGGEDDEVLPINALPDARVVINDDDELAVLSQPTTDYQHGVLGDAVEARAITLVQTQPELKVLRRIDMPAESVIEGISPIWADIDEDGEEDLLVTRSNNSDGPGARLVAYQKTGEVLAEGPLSPGGWRHQLAVFQPDEQSPLFIVDCQKPHVQRILNFYRYTEGQLQVVASNTGYSTHQAGLRNLDMALAGDLDGDGTREFLLPSTDFLEIRSVFFANGQLSEKEPRLTDAKISTNFCATSLDGKLIFGVGTEDGKLRLWMD